MVICVRFDPSCLNYPLTWVTSCYVSKGRISLKSVFPSGIPLYLWFSCPRSPFLSRQLLIHQIRSLYFSLCFSLSSQVRQESFHGWYSLYASIFYDGFTSKFSVGSGRLWEENSFRLYQEFTSKMPPAKSAICNKGNIGEVVRGWISQEISCHLQRYSQQFDRASSAPSVPVFWNDNLQVLFFSFHTFPQSYPR